MCPNLQIPIDARLPEWQAAFEKMQGNILESHGRNYTACLMLQFTRGVATGRRLGKYAATRCTSAAAQDRQQPLYRQNQAAGVTDKQVFRSLYLSVWGYLALGYSARELKKAFPDYEKADRFHNWFLSGMAYMGSHLQDPLPLEWDPLYRQQIDAMLMLACDDAETLQAEVFKATQSLDGIARVLGAECGKAVRTPDGEPLEHFGFRDGISQPNFFGPPKGDWSIPEILLRPDVASGEPDAYGSYLVYRKLEQNVKAFRNAEEALADALQLKGSDRQRAGAMIIGRFRDGTPLTRCKDPGDPAGDDFVFDGDVHGSRCPLHAHIRKVRQRPDGRRRIVRRGVPYGNYHPLSDDPYPETGCGLLFFCFQSDIMRQFGELQQAWANTMKFPRDNVGKDPLLGQGASDHAQHWPLGWDEPSLGTKRLQLGGYVTLKGGEFFFAPSISFFHRLAAS